jgi:uroporphyrinogen-III synthase
MSIAGRGVLVTRPRELAAPLAEALELRGARALLFPAIEIEQLPAPAPLARLGDFDLVVFVSPSAVRAQPRWPAGLRAAAVGAGTARELRKAGVREVVAPAEGGDSEALLALPALASMAGRRVLIVRGEGGRRLLGDTLAARGAVVEHAECYRRRRPGADAAPVLSAWTNRRLDAVTVFSAEGLDNLFALLGAELMTRAPLFVPHARVAAHAKTRGAQEVVVAGAADDAMLERLVAYFDERA